MRFHFMCHPTQLAHDAPLFMTSGEFQSQVDTGRDGARTAENSSTLLRTARLWRLQSRGEVPSSRLERHFLSSIPIQAM